MGVVRLVVLHEDLTPSTHKSFHDAVEAQRRIGFYNMVLGFLADAWTDALHACKVKHPQTRMEQVLQLLWDELCEVMWTSRNQILHSPSSKVSTDESQTLSDRLHWFARYQHTVFDYRHQFLADLTPDQIDAWSRSAKHAKVAQLESAMRWYKEVCSQRAQNQSTIFDWVFSYKELRSGRLVGEGL